MAARALVADMALREFAAFERDAPISEEQVIAPPASAEGANGAQTYAGRGWVGAGWRDLECRSGQGAYWLVVAGVGRFVITSDGGGAAQIAVEAAGPADIVGQALVGPALVLALASQKTWCMHASAIASGKSAVAFLGESGDGKSTLAAFVSAGHDPEWQLLADDLLPVAAAPEGGAILALSHFPQLKLPADRQPAPSLPEQMPIQAIYLLGWPSHEEEDTVDIRPLSRRDAAVALVRQTVAGCLFDKDLAAQNLAFAAEVASRVPIRRLVYPRRYEILPQVRDALAADLQIL